MRSIPAYSSIPMRASLLSVLLVAAGLFGCGSPATYGDVAVGHPAAADVPLGEVRLRRIHRDVWVHVSTWRLLDGTLYPANGLLVRDGDGLLLVDSAWGEDATGALLDTVESEIGLPVRRAVVTHFHDDRVSGAEVLQQRGVTVYATPLTQRLAAAAGNAVPEAALQGLDEAGGAVTLGPVEIFYAGAGHSPDNLLVYVPDARVLFGGCAVHELARDNAGNVADARLSVWPGSIRRVRQRYPEVVAVVPGHGVPGGVELLDHTIALLEAYEPD